MERRTGCRSHGAHVPFQNDHPLRERGRGARLFAAGWPSHGSAASSCSGGRRSSLHLLIPLSLWSGRLTHLGYLQPWWRWRWGERHAFRRGMQGAVVWRQSNTCRNRRGPGGEASWQQNPRRKIQSGRSDSPTTKKKKHKVRTKDSAILDKYNFVHLLLV